MRAAWLAVLAAVGGCSSHAHIDLKFDLRLDGQCSATAPGNPPVPMRCEQMTIDCADHLLFRVRKVKDGRPGDIFSSTCLKLADAGNPRDLCELVALKEPLRLIDSVPDGTEFIFQLAALRLGAPDASCDDEANPPLRVFSGYSDRILVDGNDHQSTLHLSICGSCSDLPQYGSPDSGGATEDMRLVASDLALSTPDLGAPPTDSGSAFDAAAGRDLAGPPSDLMSVPKDFAVAPDLASICAPGTVESPYYPIGARCCAFPPGCLAPGDRCSDGTPALLPPGGCCAVCD